jgi:C-terminal processing protease CtpA/Prc
MSNARPRTILFVCLSLCLLAAIYVAAQPSPQQKPDNVTIGRLESMLDSAHDQVKEHYYDAGFHGLDWNARYKEYKEKLKQVNTLAQGYAVISQFLDGLNDSHTFFLPPPRPAHMEYGYEIMMVGDKPYIWRVKPGSDAETKLHPGDEVLALNRYLVKRDTYFKMEYFFKVLAPQASSALVVRDPQGQKREVTVETKVVEQKRVVDLANGDFGDLIRDAENSNHLMRPRYLEMGDVMILKLPIFALSDSEVDRLFGIARKHKALILDLRENPGGAVVTLDRMVANLFEDDVKIADRTGRKEHKPQIAKGRGKNVFGGKLVVLIDSKSSSASEVMARVVQLEHRGTVIGDRSSGLVMEAQRVMDYHGAGNLIYFGLSVTVADLIMKDGKSLEHVGVTPDEIILPTATDIATSKDPAMIRAAELVGLTLKPDASGKLFPHEWATL